MNDDLSLSKKIIGSLETRIHSTIEISFASMNCCTVCKIPHFVQVSETMQGNSAHHFLRFGWFAPVWNAHLGEDNRWIDAIHANLTGTKLEQKIVSERQRLLLMPNKWNDLQAHADWQVTKH